MTKLYVNTALDWLIVNTPAEDWLLVDGNVTAPPTSPTYGSYPTTPAWMNATISSLSPTLVSVTNSLKRQARSRGAHAWGIELRYGAMTRAQFAPLWAFLVSQAGQAELFSVSLSAIYPPLGTASGTPLVNGGSQTGTSLVTDGWSNSQTVLKAGDWIQVQNDLKVYMVTADVGSSGAGAATISLYPALRISPADNMSIITAPYFTCALTSDLVDIDFDQCVKARGVTVNLAEIQ
jgi:hypothetical protein